MCGRFTLTIDAGRLFEEFGVHPPADWRPRFNVAPTQEVLAIVGAQGERRAGFLRWGLVPSWADAPAAGARHINARAETVARKPSFRSAFRRRRCLVPADGFYEWLKSPAGKRPVHIRLAGGSPFAFAGIWERWSGDGGAELLTCAILTTEASPPLRHIHLRMPVILDRAGQALWLDPDADANRLAALSTPREACDGTPFESRFVSELVNTPANDVPACVVPLADAAPEEHGSIPDITV